MINSLDVIHLSCMRQQRTLFSGLSFNLHAGKCVAIEGLNGSGKSSLLRLLTGLSTPECGDILWQNTSIYKNRVEYNAMLHYVSHSNGLKWGLTVAENLSLARHLSLSSPAQPMAALLDELALSAHQHQPAYSLSAGQKRRLALAKLFLFTKPLWILDEPFTSLDANTQTFFLSKLENHLNNGGMCILSSHHPIHFKKIPIQRLRLTPC